MDDLDDIELTEEDIDKYIPYRNEIQDILEKEELQKLLGDKADKLEFHSTINYDESKWLFPDFRFNNFIIEYNGTFWHADPKKFNADDIVHHEIKAKEIWERDEIRRSIFKKLGYILIEVWSDDYKANKVQVLNEIVRQIL